jgi:hypothetical protein
MFYRTQKNTTFRKLDLFPSSDVVQETHNLLVPLERYNPLQSSFWDELFVKDPTPTHEDGNRPSFRKVMVLDLFRIPQDGPSPLPSFIYIRHCENHFESQNYWVSERCPSSGILKTREHRFGKWVCFRPQLSGETPTVLGPLERANLSYWSSD